MVEEFLALEGEDMDLKLLSQSFSSGPVKVQKRKAAANGEERYFMILEGESLHKDEDVLADGTKALAIMVAIILKDGTNFKPPRVRGIAKVAADGSLTTFLNAQLRIEVRTAGGITEFWG
jgi:hypothetical protein